MFNLITINHSKITPELLDKIIKLKSVAWSYSYEEQKKWIYRNIKNNDIHVLLLKNDEIISYLNLIDIELLINGKKKKAFGIGNVCAVEKGKGFGREIMKQVNQFIIERKRIGLLFCKIELVEFYKKNCWSIILKDKIILPFDKTNIETMIFNQNETINGLKYNGKTF